MADKKKPLEKAAALAAEFASGAKPEPSKADWEKFGGIFKSFQSVKREIEQLSEREETLKADIRTFVVAHGTKEKPGTDDAKVIYKGFQIHNLAVKGRTTKDNEETQVSWLKKNFPEAVTTKSVEVVDQLEYDRLKREGKIPADVLKAFGEGKFNYQLRVRAVGKTTCDAINSDTGQTCGAVIDTKDKFCKECGAKLIFDVAPAKEIKEIEAEMAAAPAASGRRIEIDD